MPELAEVEFYRQQWNPGLRGRIQRVELHAQARVFRGVPAARIVAALTGARLLDSEAHGKRMLFRFSDGAWLGVHLGMTGRLSCEMPAFIPGRHDHLVLRQAGRSLVFSDPRQFGRIQFHGGADRPRWWRDLAPQPHSAAFTLDWVQGRLQRHARAPIKAVLLNQEAFPGIGNWMADEILWRIGCHPATPAGSLIETDVRELWKSTRSVSRQALRCIGEDGAEPPRGWLFHQRWKVGGVCPRHGSVLCRNTIGGRTSVWCPRCQQRVR
ncbi:MAG TPA: DNA-formamidopyrimidine glycosylase family protein [Methylomirabilota bacterium]|nr:DNA-formamidopyrimidine glycosylase family protein [Methylomirabilota bacterium]